mgnify:CR=1 FL=1
MSFWSSRRSELVATGGDFEIINSSKEFQKEMNALWSNIRKNVSDSDLPRTILFCSSSRDEGCSTITTGLSMFAARHSNKKVAIVDTQLEELYLTDFLLEHYPELSMEEEATSSSIGFREYTLTNRNLYFIQIINPGDMNDSEESISSFESFLVYLKNTYDFIFFDSAPVLTAPVSNFLANRLDHIIFVVSANRFNQLKLVSAINSISCEKEKLLGIVMNKRRNALPGFLNKLIG